MKSKTGKAMKNGNVSKIQVRRVSFGEIPDQIQNNITISSNTNGYLLNDIRSFMYIFLFINEELRGRAISTKTCSYCTTP